MGGKDTSMRLMNKLCNHLVRGLMLLQLALSGRKTWKQHLQNGNDLERNTCQSKDNMKKTLSKLEAIKCDNLKHESDACEGKGAQKWQLGKLIELKVQFQSKWGRLSMKVCNNYQHDLNTT